MTRKEEEMHDELVERLEDRLRPKYAILQAEVEITDAKGVLKGKVDLMGVVDGMVDLYEVKVNDGKKKATRQLRAYRSHLQRYAGVRCPINLYYYSGRTRHPVKIE